MLRFQPKHVKITHKVCKKDYPQLYSNITGDNTVRSLFHMRRDAYYTSGFPTASHRSIGRFGLNQWLHIASLRQTLFTME
jgi:hypothetical protein